MLIGWVMSHEYQRKKDKVSINELNQQTDNAKPAILKTDYTLESSWELLKIHKHGFYLEPINLESSVSGAQILIYFLKLSKCITRIKH